MMPSSMISKPFTKIGQFKSRFGAVTPENDWLTETNQSLFLGDTGRYGYPDFPPNMNVGGTFKLQGFRTQKALIGVGQIRNGSHLGDSYTGSVAVWVDSVGPGSYLGPESRAAEAYAKMKPTKPSFAGLNALYELRELPGMLRQRFLHQGLYAIPNYWLALQFGWKPLLNDIRKMCDLQQKAQRKLKWLLRNNGKPVRTACVLADFSNDAITSNQTGIAATRPTGAVYQQKATRIDTSGSKIWASARFRYWLPDGPRDIAWQRRMMAALYGLNPAPSVVYNAIPWSWLVDWFTNTGYLIENLETGVADRLAADYFYVMREDWKRRSQYCEFKSKVHATGEERSHSGTSHSYAFQKARVKGDPFGWNTNENSLTSMQLSIIGALGLSRLR